MTDFAGYPFGHGYRMFKVEQIEKLQATADRRMALLNEIEKCESFCVICEEEPHHRDCELAKELADDMES